MAQPYAPLVQQMLLDFQQQRLEAAERIATSILRINPKDLVALQVQGLSMAMQGRIVEAVTPLSKAAQQDSKNPELLTNLAKAQHGANLFSQALETFEKLKRLSPNNPQILTDLATTYAKLKRYELADANYKKALELDPNYFLAWSNLGNLQSDLRLTDEAIASYEKALKLSPNYAEAWTNRGNAFFDLGDYEEALISHEKALSINPHYGEAWVNHGNVLQELKRLEEAFVSYQKAFNLKPLHPYLYGKLLAAKFAACIWDNEEPTVDRLLELVRNGVSVSIPFVLLQTPASLEIQKRGAELFIADRVPVFNQKSLSIKPKKANEKVRIGYFSSDFKNHPVGILMEGILKFHDRSKFEVVGFFLNKRTADEVEIRISELFDCTYDLFELSDQAAQDLILGQNIDIAIDLNGHTAGARLPLFARRVAPLQVGFLGYAGTTGANFFDYLIADEVVIPFGEQAHYTEKIAYLPHSFFPVDTTISPAKLGSLPDRVSQGLPELGFVFSCFNNSYKITSHIFTIWMDLLKQVPLSVLWLSHSSARAADNLRAEAKSRGVDPNRLIFANRVPGRVEHLSRLRLADLFLDTPNYNAHATAADALWVDVPVLTQIGQTYAGRVAASQIMALGFPEMVAHSENEYIAKALDYAMNPYKLNALRDSMKEKRGHNPLFDTATYVKNLESLYKNLLTPNL